MIFFCRIFYFQQWRPSWLGAGSSPKDHFFDSEDRAERKHAKRKNATITKFGAPCMGIKPIRQY
jgi:hypothetical protein